MIPESGAIIQFETRSNNTMNYIRLPYPLNPDCCQFIVNMDRWKALRFDIQEMLEAPIAKDISKYIDKMFWENDIKTLERVKKYGVKIQTMPENEVEKARAMAHGLGRNFKRSSVGSESKDCNRLPQS